ncbi:MULTISPECIES: YHS domain-containing (seleno)protein [unclassified Vibrio]|uniref:YHS domain-containing (Seleno)protein n=1 Tax=Vibrio sp. HB236076 TaxID=3232307 RepID=A0AB39HK29_9VIBR|nr:YHS domain-containing (seleno)protein [Vibrio sp. HB161653]MDP5253074.1 YHS domain-containing (seleno)protein [Vibrio sp. HB161653]
MRKFWLLVSLLITPLMFSLSAHAQDPVYTSFFSSKAVGGYDTVAYFTENKPVKGSDQFKTRYQGADWYFSSQENLDLFVNNPDKYAPQYGGYCAWAVAAKNDFAPGDPLHWRIVGDKLYLNYDQSVQEMWNKDIPGFIAQAEQNWPALINQ